MDLAEALTMTVDPKLGWYCVFRTDEETFVVFSDRVNFSNSRLRAAERLTNW